MFVRAALAAALLSCLPIAQAKADVILLISHEVKDFDAWKKGYDADKVNRDKGGFKEIFLSRETDKPNVVHIGFRAPSAEKAKAFMDNPELKTAMEKAGVVGPPTFTLTDSVKPAGHAKK
jgi:hypothetical protein